jgi:threonine aldolase
VTDSAEPSDAANQAGQADTAGQGQVPENEPTIQDRIKAALPNAKRWLPGARPMTPAEALRSLAEEAARQEQPDEWDRYGTHGPVAALETKVAELLGKPAAAMFPSGIMAQQSVLRVWSDRQASKRVAIQDLSHLLTYENDGPQQLNDFRFERLTTGPTTATAEHLAAIPGRLAAALVELPLRDAGYLLPTWDELSALSEAARERGVPLHVDGARLWESQPYLDHSLAEIAGLADSVYVSFYKGLGGDAGAVVAGPQDVVDEARRWRTRHGGTLFSMTAFALGGLRGLRTRLPRMGELYQRAVELAAAFESRGFRVHPQPPHTNAFRIFVDQPAAVVNERIVTLLEDEGLVLIAPMNPGDMPGTAWTEFTVNLSSLDWGIDEAADAVARLLG